MGRLRGTLVLVCVATLAACVANTQTAPSVPLDKAFTLAPGETARIDGTALSLRFLRVTGDSRCPADAVCIQGGDAIVLVRASAGSAEAQLELHTGDADRGSATFQDFRVTLAELQPYPFSSRTIEPGEYRATLRVARRQP